MKLLLIEDEDRTVNYLRKGLCENGYQVDVARDGLDGYHLATSWSYALILLDVSLPKVDGYTLLGRMRHTNVDTPVLFITARDSVSDRVRGLQLGADDYLVKPFAFSELLARVHCLLRRCHRSCDGGHKDVIRIGDLEIDEARHRVTRAHHQIDLTAQQFALLLLLARHEGQVVSRATIAEQIWDMNFDSDTNVVDVAIRRLRCRVDDPFQDKLICSVRGSGYVLQPVRH